MNTVKKYKYLGQCLIALAFLFIAYGQKITPQTIWEKVKIIQENETASSSEKMQKMLKLKTEFETNKFEPDSVYARILDRLAIYHSDLNSGRATEFAIENTLKAFGINNSNKLGSSVWYAIGNSINLSSFFSEIGSFRKAMAYTDTSIALIKKNQLRIEWLPELRFQKIRLYLMSGDYKSVADEATAGYYESVANHDTTNQLEFLIQKSHAQLLLESPTLAEETADTAFAIASSVGNKYQMAAAEKNKALAVAENHDYKKASALFSGAINTRLLTKNYSRISDDYTDFGNYYLWKEGNYDAANNCYFKSAEYAKLANDNQKLAASLVNIGATNFLEGKYDKAYDYYGRAFSLVAKNNTKQSNGRLTTEDLNSLINKDLAFAIIRNRAEALLELYKKYGKQDYLLQSLNEALVTDSLISEMRKTQSSERSKLYWRSKTRNFFATSIEACFTAADPALAFYFMEKSRAVLLNDKLNELGASSYLPDSILLRLNELQSILVTDQGKLEPVRENTKEYQDLFGTLQQHKTEYENFIKSLEQKYPAYYQYKYADTITSLKTLQQYLSAGKQYFVHYFIGDSAIYILGVTIAGTKMIKHRFQNYGDTLSTFLELCANKRMLNANYDLFARSSHQIYETLFESLQVPKGRVIVCPDNFLVPFEALCSDVHGENFLANNYAFSYVYSAGYLLKKFHNPEGKGNFLGFAPVNFNARLELPDLKNSDKQLERSADYYSGTRLLTGENATKKNFLSLVSGYQIVNVYSHAKADSSDAEPMLFMSDSSVKLSELQKITNPSAKLVVLSACQTNVGKKATGEGIYSLARGFASAGIPGVAATLWKADDLAIYEITAGFHENISKGLAPDEALQQAKLTFLKNSSRESAMPYYWANMVFIGNVEPVGQEKSNYIWWSIAGITLTAVVLKLFLTKRNKSSMNFFQL